MTLVKMLVPYMECRAPATWGRIRVRRGVAARARGMAVAIPNATRDIAWVLLPT